MPTPVNCNVPVPTDDVPIDNAFAPLESATLFAPLLFKPTLPVKSFALANVMTPAPALIVAAPAPAACVMAPDSVIPTPVNCNVPVPTDDVPIDNAFVPLESATLFTPLLFKPTLPVKSLPAVVRVMTPAPALMAAAPAPAV